MSERQPGWLLREIEAKFQAVERGPDALHWYQSGLLIPFLYENPFSAAFVDMGLGKTVSILTLLDRLMSENPDFGTTLIIAPLRVAAETWPTEISLWRHTAWMTHSLIRANEDEPEVLAAMAAARARVRGDDFAMPAVAAQRARTAMMEALRARRARAPQAIHIINREAVDWLVELHGPRHWPYQTIIVDESSSFSDHKTARFKALARVRNRVTRLHLLSGTPAAEGLHQLFAQTYLLDGGARFGRFVTHFQKKYFDYNSYSRKYSPKEDAEKQITEKLADICLVMKEEDYLDIEKPLVIERPIKLTRSELKQYKDFERELIIELPNDVVIEAETASVLAQKMLQLASGFIYDSAKKAHQVHDHKIAELIQLREEAQGSPLLVAYWFKPSLARLRKAFPKAVVMDKEGKCVDDWNRGKIDMLFIHPASAGHGLNMQKGPGHTLIFFDNPWSLELYLQIVKRLARQGQKRLVRVYHLVTKETLDDVVVPKLKLKEDAQESILRRLRALRKAMLTRRADNDDTGDW